LTRFFLSLPFFGFDIEAAGVGSEKPKLGTGGGATAFARGGFGPDDAFFGGRGGAFVLGSGRFRF
jgi:hypothetical protein